MLVIEVGRPFFALHVVDGAQFLFAVRGNPEHMRSDNGP